MVLQVLSTCEHNANPLTSVREQRYYKERYNLEHYISDYYYFYLLDALQFCCQATYSGVPVAHYFSFLCCVLFVFVLCPVSCVHGVACFSGLSVLDSPLRFSLAFISKTYSTPVITTICAIYLTIPVSCSFFCL